MMKLLLTSAGTVEVVSEGHWRLFTPMAGSEIPRR
jgi:hypothetical protein